MGLTRPVGSVPVRLASGEAHLSLPDHLERLNPFLSGIARRLSRPDPTPGSADPGLPLRMDAGWLLEFFEVEDPASAASATMAWQMLAMHAILQDHRLDGDVTDREEVRGTELLGNVLLLDSLHLLSGLAGNDPDFWAAAHEAFDAYARAHAAEADLGTYYRSPPDDTLIGIVTDRAEPVKVLAAALGCLSGRKDRTQPAIAAVRHLTFAGMIRDDVADWRADRRAGKPTYVLMRLADRLGRSLPHCTDDELADEMYLHGGLEEFVAQIGACLRTAVLRAAGMPGSRFVAYARALERESRAVAAAATARKSAYVAAARAGR